MTTSGSKQDRRGSANGRAGQLGRVTALAAAMAFLAGASPALAQGAPPHVAESLDAMAGANVRPVELPGADEPQAPRLPTAATLRQMILDLESAAAQSVQVSLPATPPAPFPGPITLPGQAGAGTGPAGGLRPSMLGDPTGRR